MNKRLKKYIEEQGMRPEELASKLGCSLATIGRLDPIKSPKRPLAIAIAFVTGISIQELFPESKAKSKAS